jgi:membrane-anchored mycosin MYCP
MPLFEHGEAGDRWVPNEFVVALRDVDIVRSELRELHISDRQVVVVDSSPELGLSLVKIENIERAAARLDTAGQSLAVVNRSERSIERVVRALREQCRSKYGRWEPVVGKNRVGDGVHGAPDIGIGGRWFPERSDHPTVPEPDGDGQWIDVGILDTGIVDHRELAGRWVQAGDSPLLDPDEEPWYVAGHGTFVAGLVLRYAPNARLHVRKVLDNKDGAATAWEVAKAMVSFDKVVRVLNLSFCCFTADGQPPLVLSRAIDRLDPDMVVVAAAGNHADSPSPIDGKAPSWPAAFDRVIAAGAYDPVTGRRAEFSPDAPWVTLTAPGKNVTSTYLSGVVRLRDEDADGDQPRTRRFNGSARWSGTSFATGVISGVIAQRMLEVQSLTRGSLQDVINFTSGSDQRFSRSDTVREVAIPSQRIA